MAPWAYNASAVTLFFIGFFGFFLNLFVIALMCKDMQVSGATVVRSAITTLHGRISVVIEISFDAQKPTLLLMLLNHVTHTHTDKKKLPLFP